MTNILQTTHRDIAWFKQADDLNQLEMKPPFQRNLVWTKKQQSFLIDSVINGFPIPELYMQDIVSENGEKKYIVVDGQQRISACLQYINGDFQVNDSDSPTLGGLSFDDLSVEQKKKLYAYQFIVRLLPELSDVEIREIFQRLNRNNVVLNPQELRQATYWGEFISLMNELSKHELWTKVDVFTPTDIKRMKDVEFISELVIGMLYGVQNKKTTIDKYYKLYEEEFEEKDMVQQTFERTLREIIKIMPDIGSNRWSKKTDFYTLFIYLSKFSSEFPLGSTLRKDLCEQLEEFASKVDSFVKVEDIKTDNSELPSTIVQYALSLRASSDLGARRKRHEALSDLLMLESKIE